MEQLAQQIAQTGFVSASDVMALRQNVFCDGIVSQKEADAVWQLAAQSGQGDPAWHEFFTEALTDYYVNQVSPKGYIDLIEASDIIERLCAGSVEAKQIAHPLAFDLLVNIIEKSQSVPDVLTEFALQAIEHTVLSGDGPTRHGPAAKGAITKGDVAYIRRVLYAAGSAGNQGISRCEAELLFHLNDATIEAKNDPEWSDLFVKAISSHLMAHIGYRPPPREEALRRAVWLDDRSTNVGGFLASMATSGFSGFRELFSRRDEEGNRIAAEQAAIADAERVTRSEADWLAKRIGADGIVHENEKALIAYMKSLDAELPASLVQKIAQLEATAS